MRIEAPYHEGEILVQKRVGEFEEGRRNGAAISDSIVKGALRFIPQQSMVVLGSVDDDRNVWTSIVFGQPGFMEARDERTVIFDQARMAHNPHDPLWGNVELDPRLGMLVIELATRRRLRINGHVTRLGRDQLRLDVDEAYPNCPKYIQRRRIVDGWKLADMASTEFRRGSVLSSAHESFINSADTFFVASMNPQAGIDASHRGGRPGFVRVLNDTTLRIPDFRGNSMFNTLGNFAVHPHAGLAFFDFKHGRTLQLIGRPEIQWELDDPDNETGGTRRYWDLHVEAWIQTDLARSPRWEFLDYSPHNPKSETSDVRSDTSFALGAK
ncbi:MAG: pyridoxamine 5'-phosphate oxidase family protein [Phycisphaerales bacterium]|nr:pyridoxamine 5'-phosphate oxidase family protein [Phycisphaerales bacterium]